VGDGKCESEKGMNETRNKASNVRR
jgi:hypothetical protein